MRKMNYLANLLVGEAEIAVRGLTLGNQNYVIARDLFFFFFFFKNYKKK